MRRVVLLLVGIGLIIGGGWYYIDGNGQQPSNIITLHGNIDIREAELGFRVFGRLQKMYVEEGDQVKTGDLLAQIDDAPYVDAVNVAASDVEQKTLAHKNSASIAARKEKLVKSSYVSKEEAESSQTTRDQALAMQHQSEANLAIAKTNLKDTQIHAPSNGVIISRVEEPGSILNPGTNVYVMALSQPIWARVYITETDLGRIYPGMKAKVYSDSQPGKPYAAQVGFISPVAEFTPKTVETAELRTKLVYRLRVIITHPDHLLRQGMPVTVRLDTQK